MAHNTNRTKEKSAVQAQRTAKNQIKRFMRNIAERPNHSHAKVWTSKVAEYEKV